MYHFLTINEMQIIPMLFLMTEAASPRSTACMSSISTMSALSERGTQNAARGEIVRATQKNSMSKHTPLRHSQARSGWLRSLLRAIPRSAQQQY